MPIRTIYKNKKPIGYRWGNSGKLYLISKHGVAGALGKAQRQRRASYSSGYTGVKKHKRKTKKGNTRVKKHRRKVRGTEKW